MPAEPVFEPAHLAYLNAIHSIAYDCPDLPRPEHPDKLEMIAMDVAERAGRRAVLATIAQLIAKQAHR